LANKDSSTSEGGKKCVSCGTELVGNYCHQCGEKQLVPSRDFSVIKFIEQAIDGITHFDSKFLKSMLLLFTKPGFLTLEFIRGKRSPYTKPVQLFIIADILFYFIFPVASSFFASVSDMKAGYNPAFSTANIFRCNVDNYLIQKARVKNLSVQQLTIETEKEASHKSKVYLFLILPFWGAIIYLLFRHSISYYVPHLIFAVHSFTFFIIIDLVYLWSFVALGFYSIAETQLYFLLMGFLIYLFIAVRKVYRIGWFGSVVRCLFIFLGFIILMIIYRQAITVWALHSV
jgi:hypothetical protein